MKQSDLHSEAPTSETPEEWEGLYELLAMTAVDFRAVPVPEEWHEELWDLAEDVRENTPRSSPISTEQQESLLPGVMMAQIKEFSQSPKERHLARLEEVKKVEQITTFHKRLRTLRQNAFFDSHLDEIDTAGYRSRAAELSATSARRLGLVEQLRVTPDEVMVAAQKYLGHIKKWTSTGDTGKATPEEIAALRRDAEEAKKIQQRAADHAALRHRVIFRWEAVEEPVEG